MIEQSDTVQACLPYDQYLIDRDLNPMNIINRKRHSHDGCTGALREINDIKDIDSSENI